MNNPISSGAATSFSGAARVRAAVESMAEASILLQLYTHTLASTPMIVLPEAADTLSGSTVSKDLPLHQKTALQNVDDYVKDISPLMANLSASVLGFGNFWNADFKRLMGYIPRLSDPEARANFDSGLAGLQAKIIEQQAGLSTLLGKLTAFQKLVIIDRDQLARDSALVAKAFEGAGGEIASLKARIVDGSTRRGQYIGTIAAGATVLVGGIVTIVVGIAAFTATSGAVVLAGIGLLAVGGSALLGAATALGMLNEQIAKDTATLTKDEATYAALEQASHNAASLSEAVNKGVGAVSSLLSGWQQVATDFEQIKQELDVANPDVVNWLTMVMNKANDEWNDALGAAKALQSFDNIPVAKKVYGKAA